MVARPDAGLTDLASCLALPTISRHGSKNVGEDDRDAPRR